MSTIKDAFDEFDAANPSVWHLFKRFAFEAIEAGHARLASKLIVERIRWETMVVTRGDRFKVNNNFTAHYARRFMEAFPQHVGLFELRRSPRT